MDKIICVGKNYAKHAKELGGEVPDRPMLFLKPPSTQFVCTGMGRHEVRLPRDRGEVHHELEIVGKISNGQLTHVTLGLDLTLRDLQNRLKKDGHPWEKAKVFENSSIIGPWLAVHRFQDFLSVPFELQINGQLRQKGLGSDMHFSIPEILNEVAACFPMRDGDWLFTGTPEGVGPLLPGDSAMIRWGEQLNFPVNFV